MRGWIAMIAVGCSVEPDASDDEDADETVNVEAFPDDWEYASFCWFAVEAGCKLDGGERVGDERVNCVDVEDTYECVVEALDELGGDGWRIELGEDSFPQQARVYLMWRAG